MPQLIRLITPSHIYSAANNKVGRETREGERGNHTSPHKFGILAISEEKH